MSTKSIRIWLYFMILWLMGCNAQVGSEPSTTPALLIMTASLPPTLTPRLPETPLPRLVLRQPTAAPVEGITSTQLNVRAEPSTASDVLGIIPADTRVEIVGKDPGENWWQILYPQGLDGRGWVTAQYVTTAIKPEVPTIGGGGAEPNSGNVAIIQQKINIRSGPGTDFNSIGTLNPQDVARLTGKDANGIWLRIEFATGPEGKGWISAAFVQANGVENLPILTDSGQVVGTGTPTTSPPPPTPTLVSAWMDDDSVEHPIAQVTFNAAGTRTLIYNGEVSAPEGDAEDWIGFTPYRILVLVSLECVGSGSLKVDIMENNLPRDLAIECGQDVRAISVEQGVNYLIHLQALRSSEDLQYIKYTLTVKTSP